MSSPIPIQLSGNLGFRHRCINDLVHQTYSKNVPFHAIQALPEESTVDRLFKIDLAAKHKNVDYILETLKGDDMLYVARALKSTFLLQRECSRIVNPEFLETDLYPQMRLQAITKMKNWIHLHLRDPERCNIFYTFYKDRDFDLAAKFLNHCSDEFILKEFNNILDKITPKLLKLLSERVPQVTKIYFDSLKENPTLLANYLKRDGQFFATVKYVLKSDADIFFYVLENFFAIDRFPSFSSEITKYIIKNHKTRFMNKPELYTSQFLDIKTIAECLNSEETKDLIRLLARAQYLSSWFSYQNVEPLIKSLSIEERTAVKKQIFVDKDFGSPVQAWPYALPDIPKLHNSQNGLFKDQKVKLSPYDDSDSEGCRVNYRRKNRASEYYKTLLDQLFDEYRFKNYSETFTELQKRVRAESTAQNRQYMLLVLVSKAGGRLEDVISLLDFLKLFRNEPVHIRATIVRSLVKRAFVWRLPPQYWTNLLQWAHGLGLDGSEPEAACTEGLYAVVIRDILANVTPTHGVWNTFLANLFEFSCFFEYKLSADEQSAIKSRLPALLLAEARSSPDNAAIRINQLLDTLAAYHIPFDKYPGTIEAIVEIANRDVDAAKILLSRIYSARVARKTLFKINFELIPTKASYVNALRHDCSVLDNTEHFKKIAKTGSIQERFLRKLALYFTEKDGLAQRHRTVLESLASKSIQETSKNEQIKIVILGRPLALLAGYTFPSLLSNFSYEPRVRKTTAKNLKILAGALRANSHEVRPPFDIESFGWQAAGAKSVANRAMTCRQQDVEQILQKTLSWSRTMRLSLLLAERVNKTREAYEIVASKRPNVALMSALRYFRRRGDNSDLEIWKIVRPVMEEHYITRETRRRPTSASTGKHWCTVSCCHRRKGITRRSKRPKDLIDKLNIIPSAFKADFGVTLFKAYKKATRTHTHTARQYSTVALQILQIPLKLFTFLIKVLPDVDDTFLHNEIKDFLQSEISFDTKDAFYNQCSFFYFDIIAKYLVLGTSNEVVQQRLQNVGNLFFNRFEDAWRRFAEGKDIQAVNKLLCILNNFLCSLKYSIVFFDPKYACLPVFERLGEWLQGFLPIEKWFDVYSKLQLTMLYLKATRLCVGNSPETFADESRKLKDGVKMLGITYGKLIANSTEDLTRKYYPSIILMYKVEVEDYIKFLCTSSDESTQKFQLAVVKGILSEQQLSSQIVALHLFVKFNIGVVEDPYLEDIKHILKVTKNEELRFHIENSYLSDIL